MPMLCEDVENDAPNMSRLSRVVNIGPRERNGSDYVA